MTAAQACDLMTIGHSNLPADRFITLLRDSKVSAIIDVRSVPFSRWCPWFSSKPLATRLAAEGLAYLQLGLPRPLPFDCAFGRTVSSLVDAGPTSSSSSASSAAPAWT